MNFCVKWWAFLVPVVMYIILICVVSCFAVFEIVSIIKLLFFLFNTPPSQHACLWCTILALEMQLAHDKRSLVQERTLQHLRETFQKFQTKVMEQRPWLTRRMLRVCMQKPNRYRTTWRISSQCAGWNWMQQILIQALYSWYNMASNYSAEHKKRSVIIILCTQLSWTWAHNQQQNLNTSNCYG